MRASRVRMRGSDAGAFVSAHLYLMASCAYLSLPLLIISVLHQEICILVTIWQLKLFLVPIGACHFALQLESQ